MSKRRPVLEARTFMLSRRAYKELCRTAAYHRMNPSVYVECLALKWPLDQAEK